MASQEKKLTRQFGKQPPQYRFFLNPYRDARFTRCPQCEQSMHQKKVPLVIHIDPSQLFTFNKTCRYCPHCDLLIMHKDVLEGYMKAIFSDLTPAIESGHYLVMGTLEKADWKRNTTEGMEPVDVLEVFHAFREVVTFKSMGGWGPA